MAIDEGQNILPSERNSTATDVVVKYIREGRNHGLSVVIATQQPTSINSRILAQMATMIAHKGTIQGDIDSIRRDRSSGLPGDIRRGNASLAFGELTCSLDVGQASVSNAGTGRAFVVNVRARPSVHGGF